MTVAELIEELKKYPQDLQVATTHADHCEFCAHLEVLLPDEINEAVLYTETGHKFDVIKIGY